MQGSPLAAACPRTCGCPSITLGAGKHPPAAFPLQVPSAAHDRGIPHYATPGPEPTRGIPSPIPRARPAEIAHSATAPPPESPAVAASSSETTLHTRRSAAGGAHRDLPLED